MGRCVESEQVSGQQKIHDLAAAIRYLRALLGGSAQAPKPVSAGSSWRQNRSSAPCLRNVPSDSAVRVCLPHTTGTNGCK
jgi:hypothetical protein